MNNLSFFLYYFILLLTSATCVKVDSNNLTTGPTIVALSPFDPDEIAKKIRGFEFISFYVHYDDIIAIVLKLTAMQRLQTAVAYEAQYAGKNFKTEIDKYFGKDDLAANNMMELISTVPDFLARRIEHSLKKKGKDLGYMSILCTSNSQELRNISASYRNEYHQVDLTVRMLQTLGDKPISKFLLAMVLAKTADHSEYKPDAEKTANLTRRIMDDIVTCSDDETASENGALYQMFTKESFQQIHAVGILFKNLTGSDIIEKIKKNCTSDLKYPFGRILQYSMDPIYYFASEIEQDFKGTVEIDSAATRVLISRSEIDLADIRTRYDALYEKGLLWAIEDQ